MTQFVLPGTNPAATGVPDLYLAVNNPPASTLPGAQSGILGVVGVATWGPVDSPVVFGDEAGGAAAFGAMVARKYDLMTVAHAAVMQGANSFVGVRRTDGTDVAASKVVQSTCITLTAKYTGSRGNNLLAVIAAGTAPSTTKITLSLPGLPSETFDNLSGSGNAFWVAMASAINNGQGATRPPSALVTATAGAGTAAPVNATLTGFTGGTDGATTITSTVLLGVDTSPRTGIFALRGTGCAVVVLADADDTTVWSSQLAFAKSELCEVFCVSPAGDTLSNFASTNTVDDPWLKAIFGDWVYMIDSVNPTSSPRLVSPQGYLAGKKVAVGPANSILNQGLAGVAGTQASVANKVYSAAELAQLAAARGDLVTIPSVGGSYFSARFGRNASSDPGRHQDPYTTMTNYLARSLGLGLGPFVGRNITPDMMREARTSISSFLQAEKDAGRVAAFSVQIDANNNPPSQTAIGVLKATVLVTYFGVTEVFLVDLTGGSTVAIPQRLAA
jgi:hypothetical protein